jgi:alkylated DNA nucleotide flippase Atl1
MITHLVALTLANVQRGKRRMTNLRKRFCKAGLSPCHEVAGKPMFRRQMTCSIPKGDIMGTQEDEIVDIPENRVKFFGGSGKMLLPSPATVETLIKKIPEGQLLTADLLRKKLTDQFNVQGTCPVTTRKSLQTVAHDVGKQVAYWRVINKSGELIAHFPGGVEGHAAFLRKEGFTIDTQGRIPKVQAFTERLACFE